MGWRWLTGSLVLLLAAGLHAALGAAPAEAGGFSFKKAFRSAEKRVKKTRDRVRKHAKRAGRSIEKRAKAARDTVRFGFGGARTTTRGAAAEVASTTGAAVAKPTKAAKKTTAKARKPAFPFLGKCTGPC